MMIFFQSCLSLLLLGNVILVASWLTIVNIISLIIIIIMSKCKTVHLLSSSRLDNGQTCLFLPSPVGDASKFPAKLAIVPFQF